MSHTDQPNSSPEPTPNRVLGWMLFLAASTTGILAALLLFVLFTAPADAEQSAAEQETATRVEGKANDSDAPVDAISEATTPSAPDAAVVWDGVPLRFEVGMQAILAAPSPAGLGMPSEMAGPLSAEALLPGEALESDPLEDLGIKSLRAEVLAALADAGAFEPVPRPDARSAEDLVRDVESATPELELDRRTLESLMKTSSEDGRLQTVVSRLDDIQGMPFQWGEECHRSEQEAQALVGVAAMVRQIQNLARSLGTGGNGAVVKQALNRSVAHLLESDAWHEPSAIAALEQVFQIEGPETRLALVEKLGAIDCQKSTDALVRRALFDFDADVRQAAVEQLDRRPRDEYLDKLVEGFRYPWEPVAWHAADAVSQLEAREAAVDLMDMLDAPAPDEPYVNVRGNWAVKEVVAINHLKNCQLCHTQSLATTDSPRGVVPIPGQPMPQLYYASRNPNMQFVRADVTYLKQDFSLVLDVSDHGPWPDKQRFDYVVRERELKGKEAPVLSGKPDGKLVGRSEEKDYAQRRAVIFALQQLVADDPPPFVTTVKMVSRPFDPSL